MDLLFVCFGVTMLDFVNEKGDGFYWLEFLLVGAVIEYKLKANA